MKHKVIDNFLDEKYFDRLVALITGKQPELVDQNMVDRVGGLMSWHFDTEIRWGAPENKLSYMRHVFYEDHVPKSPLFEALLPLLYKLGAIGLLQAKANLYPNTHIIYEHAMHCDYYPTEDDYPSPCTSAIFSLNTCDGYTKLKDGTKIESVANRVLLHDPNIEHCGTTTTNDVARYVVNINYMQGVSYD